jgi:transaldolase
MTITSVEEHPQKKVELAMSQPLSVEIFADGADLVGIRELASNSDIRGFTTNPTLMNQSGITDYESFAREVLEIVGDRPVSFEVFSDEFDEMKRQAFKIASWGQNANVKIPITNTKGESAANLIRYLSNEGLPLNVTAIMTPEQVQEIAEPLANNPGAIISVFAGRIADTGRDPIPIMEQCLSILKETPQNRLLWASPREILNVYQANLIGCHIITVTHDTLKKLSLRGKDLNDYSLETVKMFFDDAVSAGFQL